MKTHVIVSIGYHHYAVPGDAAKAAKLMAALGDLVPVRQVYSAEHGYQYHLSAEDEGRIMVGAEFKLVPSSKVILPKVAVEPDEVTPPPSRRKPAALPASPVLRLEGGGR